jgi:c(7)-type cytochrome triheme protein
MRTVLFACLIASAVIALAAGPWLPLRGDGLHDPENPGIALLQQPQEALSVLPGDTAGNKVDWVRALRDNVISPRAHVADGDIPEVLESEVLMTNTSDTPYVVFPHKAHTEWMSCEVCHEELFRSEVGANDISMGHILDGEH